MILELVDRVDARAHKKASGPERGRMVVYDSFKSVHRLKFKLKPHAGLREVTLSYSLVSFSVKRANRLLATRFDNNGFDGLAAISDDEKGIQIIISNYQETDDVIQAVHAKYAVNGNSTVSGPNPLNSEGL
jgi:hypothetical protein